MHRFLLIALVSLPAAVFAVQVAPCDEIFGESYLPVDARMDGCESGKCEVSISEPLQFEIDIIAPYDTETIFINGVLLFKLPDEIEAEIPVEFPEDVADGCNNLVGTTCPLSSGDQFTWAMNWDWMPDMEVGADFDFRFKIYDQDETVMTCFRMPVLIVA